MDAPLDRDGPFGLEGQVAVVTGASRGIGAAIASAFAMAGAEVVLVARSAQALEAVAAELRGLGAQHVSVLPADVSDAATAPSLVAQVIETHRRLDILINNAGGAMPASLESTSAEGLADAFRFNVIGPFALTKAAIPHLRESGNGSVINLSSMMARFAARDHLTYATAKAALSHLTRALAIELAPYIRVNAIAPSIVETDSLRSALTSEERRRLAEAAPLQRLATVEDIALTARWLASQAAAFMTAQVINVDGGIQGPTIPHEEPG